MINGYVISNMMMDEYIHKSKFIKLYTLCAVYCMASPQ